MKSLCRKHRFSDASFYLWHGQCVGIEFSNEKRLKTLETIDCAVEEITGGVDAGERRYARSFAKKIDSRSCTSRMGAVDADDGSIRTTRVTDHKDLSERVALGISSGPKPRRPRANFRPGAAPPRLRHWDGSLEGAAVRR